MSQLDVPEDRDVLVWARREGFRIERGSRPALELYRSRFRRTGRGEQVGVCTRGRIDNLHLVESAVRREVHFRRTLVTPAIEVALMVDVRRLDGGADGRRLLSVAALTGAVTLGMPSTAMTLHVLGTRRIVPPLRLVGLGSYRLLKRSIEGFAGLEPEPRLSPGRLRRACLFAPEAHPLIVSHFMPARVFEGFRPPSGASLLLVTPPSRRLVTPYGDAVGWAAFEDAGASEEGCLERYRNLINELRPKKIQGLIIGGRKNPLDALTVALNPAPLNEL
jgi:hypothetical protein